MSEEKTGRKNLFIEFQQNSGDFLKVLGELSAKADTRKPVLIQHKDIADMASTIELFWDITEKIFLEYEKRVHEYHLLSVNEHAKAVILQNELREVYNEMYRRNRELPKDMLAKFLSKTAMPKKSDFENDVQLKNKPSQPPTK